MALARELTCGLREIDTLARIGGAEVARAADASLYASKRGVEPQARGAR